MEFNEKNFQDDDDLVLRRIATGCVVIGLILVISAVYLLT
jgi:hypothetical protein